MKLTDGERLIIVMLADVMGALKVNRGVDPDIVKKLVINKDDWALAWEYSGIFEGEQPSKGVIKETVEILDMWRSIEFSIKELKGNEAEEASKFKYTHFDGFDGNNDPHYGVAHTLINDLGRWSELKGYPLNSHSSVTLEHYRVMLLKYQSAEKAKARGLLSFEALRYILS